MAERPQSEQNLTVEAEQLGPLLDAIRELVSIVAPDGSFQFVNAAFTRILGYRAEELVGTNLGCLIHTHDATGVIERLSDLASKPRAGLRQRCRLRAKDGTWRCLELEATNRFAGEGADGILVTMTDVTDLTRMESERQVISEVIHALNETANLDQLLFRIHQALKKVMYAENCFVALHEPETDLFHFPFLVDQYDSAPPPQKAGRSCTAYVFRTGRAMLIPQSEFDRLAAEGHVELVGSASPAWLGVPLKTPSATIGVLVVQHYSNEHAYDQRDLEFLDSVGGHIALAIERKRAEEALQRSASMFRLLFEHNPLPTWVFDAETLRFLQTNEATVRQYGYSADEFREMTTLDIRPEEERESWKKFNAERAIAEGRYTGVWKQQTKEGKVLEVEIISHPLEYNGRPVRLVVAQDITERKLLEEQLRQAQKMEAVGRLAGGVAHDFNNLLMVIKGHTELLLNSAAATEQARRKVEQIDRAADRATSLTRQLLAFSRMQVLQPRVIHLGSVVEDLGKLLPRLIGEDIELKIVAASDLGMIRADASQMEQIIMNLAVNARDAMPNGGRLVIEVSNAELDKAYSASHPIVKPGSYVCLAVTDTGTGMDAETQSHIFEPFFTTKEQGKGTGLGLATVYGVVKQSGGFIWVYSEVGKGSSFKVYLPRVDQAAEKIGMPAALVEVPRGTETILLSEDEQDVREVAREFLESGGYTVLEAQNASEALRVAEEHRGTIDLLVTDMIMPGMSGQELAARLQQTQPGLRVIYMSGYSEHAATEATRMDASVRLLTKPFSRGAVLRAVREVLNNGNPQ
jgi:two-component system, cell cycle sensor histidine kinase and response regulator CckA